MKETVLWNVINTKGPIHIRGCVARLNIFMTKAPICSFCEEALSRPAIKQLRFANFPSEKTPFVAFMPNMYFPWVH